MQTPNLSAAKAIASFESPEAVNEWTRVNDTVMGGVSRSSISQTSSGTLLFEGQLSLDNNGGFVSIRNRPAALNLQNATGILVNVRGDGRTYYLDLRSRRQSSAGSFRAAFATVENEWKEIYIPFTLFKRQSFGRIIRNAVLNPREIDSVGFTLSDKMPGPFRLEIESIMSVSQGGNEELRPPLAPLQPIEPVAIIELAIAKGVPAFNNGNPSACAAIYEIACHALIAMSQISDTSRNTLSRALQEVEDLGNETEKAWILRYALDDTLEQLRETI